MVDVEVRSQGVGGSEVAAIVGLDPRRDAFSVYAEKLGLVERAEPSPRMRWGKRIERVIAEAYAEETRQTVAWCDETRANPQRPWQVMTPDAFVWRDGAHAGGVDAKNVAFDQAYLWGDAGTDAVPESIALQLQWYCSGEDLPWWDAAALFGGHDLRIYRVHRDPEIEAVLLEEADRFWRTHVLARVAPPIGSSATAAEYLRQRFPKNVEALRVATEHEASLIAELKVARSNFDIAEAAKKSIENQVKEAIGEADGLECALGKVTWKKDRDTMGTDWERIARFVRGRGNCCARGTGVSHDERNGISEISGASARARHSLDRYHGCRAGALCRGRNSATRGAGTRPGTGPILHRQAAGHAAVLG